MYRRHWPTALGLLAAMMLGWYLIYTELLVREMRRDSVAHSRIYVHILRGLNDPTEGAAEQTLLDLIEEVQALEVPIVVTDADGIPAFVSNLPFDADPTELNDQIRIARYTRELARRNTPVVEPGLGTIYFGDPPIVGRLRWVPLLQVGALLVLFAAAFWMIRHNLRVERERIWAAM
ncbi:MAG: hypothetical protein M3418_10255, partial [Gemmatimonadota bacterium]|nr:hypothetical protein [Gemmatimonadota bacterium]